MHDGLDDVDRLRAAIDAHERFVAENGRRSVSDFLAEHEPLRALLEPLLGRARLSPQPQSQTPGASARVLGDFRLLGELGRGGMGVVYDAEQISLGRRVAVKVLPGRLALDPDRRARFERESRLAASLDHPGIAKVISADTDGDVIWFAMERIDGAPLDRVLRRTAGIHPADMTGALLASVVANVAREHCIEVVRPEGMTGGPESTVWRAGHVDTVVRIGAQVADALQHAHQHGVIHRDVKLANVLLRRDGSAVLTDFGLARELNTPSLTATGDFLGTPSYSAPEQLSGDRAAVDHRADVFALGVTLYEFLTHHRPFEASTADEVRARILTVEPPRPRRLNPKITADLSTVLLKALEKDPDQRYQTAAAMAADLRAVADGRPVHAVSVRAHRRALRWCRRNRWATTALASMLGVVLLLLTIGVQLVRAKFDYAESTIRAGVARARAQDFHGALAVLMPPEQGLPGKPRQAALDELFRRYPCLASYPLTSEADEIVTAAWFSSDGDWIITRHERPYEPERERWHLRLWLVPTPNSPALQPSCRWASEPYPGTTAVVHVDSGRTVAWVDGDRTVAVGGPGRSTSRIEFLERVQHLVQANVPGRFGVRFEEHVQLCDADGILDRQWPLIDDNPRSTLVILDTVLLRTGPGATDSQWLMEPAGTGGEPVDIGGRFPRVSLDPDDQARIVITTDTTITAWRWARGKIEPDGRRECRLPASVFSYSPSADEEHEFAEQESRFGYLGNLPRWRSSLVAARFFVAGAGRSREPYIVAVEDRVLRIWGASEPHRLDPDGGGLEIAGFAPAGRSLWCGGRGTLAAWSFEVAGAGSRADVEVPDEIRDAVDQGLDPSFCGLAFDGGRAVFACASGDTQRRGSQGWVFVMSAEEPRRARAYPGSDQPTWVALSPDGRQLAVAESDGSVELWKYDRDSLELKDRVTLPALAVGATRLSCVRYLGKRFLFASTGSYLSAGSLLRWDLVDLDTPPVPVAQFEARRALRCLAISPDNHLVATGGDDGLVRVMRVVQRDGKPELEPKWYEAQGAGVFAVAFAERDGAQLLASADRHGGIRLWDAETGVQRGIVQEASERDDEMILSLDFSPDGRHLAAAQRGGRVLVWDMDRPRRCLEGNRDCSTQLLRLQAASR